MKRIYYLFISLFLIALCNVSILSQEKNYTINETSITSANGDIFTITLDANHTTGYSWTADISDTTILLKESTDYIVPETHVMGKGGNEVWKFKGVLQGSVTITFKYARPWDKDTPPAKTVTFKITIQ